MPFILFYFTAPTKYKIYVLFTLKIYSDLIEIFFRFSFAVPSVAFFSPFSAFSLFFQKDGKTHETKMKE